MPHLNFNFKQSHPNYKLPQVVKTNDKGHLWVADLLEREYGDSSFPSFIKMILDEGKQVCRSCILDISVKKY